jgi:hypothetical protein
MNSVKPQSKQTRSFGNTNTAGLSIFFSPRKMDLISALNFVWFSDPHDLQVIPAFLPSRDERDLCQFGSIAELVRTKQKSPLHPGMAAENVADAGRSRPQQRS